MAQSRVHVVTHWRIPARVDEVTAVLKDPTDLPRWWPAVYLGVRAVDRGDADGVGATYDLYTKGWLPYTLRWRLRIVAVEPLRKEVAAEGGDIRGTGVRSTEPASRSSMSPTTGTSTSSGRNSSAGSGCWRRSSSPTIGGRWRSASAAWLSNACVAARRRPASASGSRRRRGRRSAA